MKKKINFQNFINYKSKEIHELFFIGRGDFKVRLFCL